MRAWCVSEDGKKTYCTPLLYKVYKEMKAIAARRRVR